MLDKLDFIVVIIYVVFYSGSYFYLKNEKETPYKKSIQIIKSILLLFVLVFVVRDYVFSTEELIGRDKTFFKLFEVVFVIVLAFNIYNILELFLDIRIQTKKQSNTKIAWKFLIKIAITIISLVTIINLTGIGEEFGVAAAISMVGVFLGLTSSVWFPGIKSGMVMLMSKAIQEEDLIEVPELNIYGIVNSIGLFSTIIRNEVDNHRVVIANSKLENSTINNLSRPAKVGGLRESLDFKIGYIKNGAPLDPREIRSFLEDTFKKLKISSFGITIKFDKGCEVFLVNPGDHALEWKLFYYTDNIKTRLKDKYYLYEFFLLKSIEADISLSTPITIEANTYMKKN